MKPNFELLDEIVLTKGTNKKIEMLQEAIKDEDTREFLYILYNSDIYGIAETSINKMLDNTNKLFIEQKSFKQQIEFMKSLSGNAKIDSFGDFLSRYDSRAKKWYIRAILHDFPTVGIKSYNKALIKQGFEPKEVFELQLCESVILDTNKKVLDWNGLNPNETNYVQHKYDGCRCYIIKSGNNISFLSRDNKEFYSLNILREYFLNKYFDDDFIFDGEIISLIDFNTLMKKIRSNSQIKVNEFQYKIFDIIKFNEIIFTNKTQKERFNWLKSNIVENNYVGLPETFIVNNPTSIVEIFEKIVSNGGEGIIIKPENGLYEYGSRKYWWKMKPVYEGTFEIVDVELGSGKNTLKISALHIKDKYGNVKTKVGSGLTEEDIDMLTEMGKEQLVGKFVDIWYNEILDNGLRFPRFKAPHTDLSSNVRFRDDKTEADDLIPLREKFDKIKEGQLGKNNNIKTIEKRNTIEW